MLYNYIFSTSILKALPRITASVSYQAWVRPQGRSHLGRGEGLLLIWKSLKKAIIVTFCIEVE
jgi:hypothetical protein